MVFGMAKKRKGVAGSTSGPTGWRAGSRLRAGIGSVMARGLHHVGGGVQLNAAREQPGERAACLSLAWRYARPCSARSGADISPASPGMRRGGDALCAGVDRDSILVKGKLPSHFPFSIRIEPSYPSLVRNRGTLPSCCCSQVSLLCRCGVVREAQGDIAQGRTCLLAGTPAAVNV